MDTNSTWSSITALRTEYLYFVPKLWGFVNSKISRSHMYTQKSIHFLAWTRGTRSKCKYLAGSLLLYIFLPSSFFKIFFYLCIGCFLNVFTLLVYLTVPIVSISSCQRNLMKTYHNEANTSGITKIASKIFLEFFKQSS